MKFKTTYRLLSYEEKLLYKLEEYLQENEHIQAIYKYPEGYRNLTLEEHKLYSLLLEALEQKDLENARKIRKNLPKIPPKILDVENTLNNIPNNIKNEIIHYALNEKQQEETIKLKCLECGYEQEHDLIDIDIDNYPITHCPKCYSYNYVPLELYKIE